MKMSPQSYHQDKLHATEVYLSRKSIVYYFHKAANDPTYREKLGHHYLESEHQELSDATKEGFNRWIRCLHQNLSIRTRYVYGQPYPSSEEMAAKVKEMGVLEISVDYNDPVVLTPAANLLFRALHDVHHILLKAPFSWEGELTACRYFCRLTKNPIFHRILFSEIALQAAANVALGGKFPDAQKLVLSLHE